MTTQEAMTLAEVLERFVDQIERSNDRLLAAIEMFGREEERRNEEILDAIKHLDRGVTNY